MPQNPFFKYYFTAAVANAFQNMYDDKDGLQALFVGYWQQLAVAFKGNPYVLGYELFNEPVRSPRAAAAVYVVLFSPPPFSVWCSCALLSLLCCAAVSLCLCCILCVSAQWAGDIYRDPLLLIDMGLSDKKNLVPLYNRLTDAIRAIDPDHIVFFEPSVSDYGFSCAPTLLVAVAARLSSACVLLLLLLLFCLIIPS